MTPTNPIDAAAREIAMGIQPWLTAMPEPPERLPESFAAVIRRHLEVLPVAEPAVDAAVMKQLAEACAKLDELDWCGGYEMVQHDVLQDALDKARVALAAYQIHQSTLQQKGEPLRQ